VAIEDPCHVPELIVPTDVKLDATTLGPKPVALRTWVPLISYTLPVARLISWLEVQAVVEST